MGRGKKKLDWVCDHDHTQQGFFKGFFLLYSKPSILALWSLKTNIVFIYKSQFHNNFKLTDPVDIAPPALILETGFVLQSRFFDQNVNKKIQKKIMTYLMTQLIKKTVQKKT